MSVRDVFEWKERGKNESKILRKNEAKMKEIRLIETHRNAFKRLNRRN